jgi:hypothetical protein
LKANAKNLTNVEGSTKSKKNKASKVINVKTSSQVATASSTKKIPEMRKSAREREKKKKKKKKKKIKKKEKR